ncbi:hypothetical protein PG993_001223 [Apiospora rasikravindrae]|uniref:Uncharacterized protein n=1 Tax=Apiospora rasikravindrae TaxID=990691 RepID=A0ABR1UAS1_9PEZI
MSLRKIGPGLYIATIPPSLEYCFEDMCENFAGAWKHPPAKHVAGALVQGSSTNPDDHQLGSSPGIRTPLPHESTQCKGLCFTCAFAQRAGGPARGGPMPARPDPCTPKGHVIVMMPGVPPKSMPPPGSGPQDSNGHVLFVMLKDEEEGPPPDPRSQPPPPRPHPCIPKGRSVVANASEPLRSPRSISPQPSTSGEDTLETGSAPPSSSGTSSSTIAWEAASSAPEGQAAGRSPAAECVVCGDHFKLTGWYEH